MRALRYPMAGAAMMLGVLLLAACTTALGQAPGAAGGSSPGAGEIAPRFELITLEGERLTLDELRGKAVVLNFWASWCVPCRSEMPYFEKAYRAYRDRGVVFVGAAVEDDLRSAQSFASAFGITYPLGLDERNAIATSYQLTGLPGTMFITREGRLAQRWLGVIPEDRLISLVEEIAR